MTKPYLELFKWTSEKKEFKQGWFCDCFTAGFYVLLAAYFDGKRGIFMVLWAAILVRVKEEFVAVFKVSFGADLELKSGGKLLRFWGLVWACFEAVFRQLCSWFCCFFGRFSAEFCCFGYFRSWFFAKKKGCFLADFHGLL